MTYLQKALADLVFATESLRQESVDIGGEIGANIESTCLQLDRTIEALEELLRDERTPGRTLMTI